MRWSMILAAGLAAAPFVANAQSALTIYGGYRGGGGFDDAVTGQSIDVKEAGSLAASIDLPIDATRQYQFLVSHQKAKFEAAAQPGTSTAAIDGQSLSVTYFHVGGTNYFSGQVGRGAYVVGGIGATLFSPGANGYSDEWRPSANIGIGYEWPLAQNVSLRAEARGYITLVNSDGSLFCSGGCVVSVKGDTFTQGEALLGLSMRF